MRSMILLSVDVALITGATVFALILQGNFNFSTIPFAGFLPYLIATVTVTLIVWPASNLNRSVWRFSGMPDYLRVTGAAALTVVGAVAATFAYNRLDGVARSLPFLQFFAGTGLLTAARILHRLSHELRHNRKASATLLQFDDESPLQTVLVVGITRLAEVYLQAIAELASGNIKVAGLLGRTDRHAGRLVASQPVLGTAENLLEVLDNLSVHGIEIDRIVVATGVKSLSPAAHKALRAIESGGRIQLHFLAESMGLGYLDHDTSAPPREPKCGAGLSFEIDAGQLSLIARRRYWMAKRASDIIAAFALLVLLSPLMLLTALVVAASLGSPVVFWQQRPGLGGRPFRLYKFRSMKGSHSYTGRRLTDRERVSHTGSILRRMRLDELPQLVNILRGDMSFVGPRPLLPRDQAEAYRTRLLVRPGLTGWAQVVGGRDITAEDKAALDVWYVRNASLALDIEIALRTVPVLLFGERISITLIENAWRELSDAGILRGDLSLKTKNGLRIVYARV